MSNHFLKTEKAITKWLDKYKIGNYTLTSDEKYGYTVAVDGDVDLRQKRLAFIPVKFSRVSGDLLVSVNKLNSLEFCPEEVRDSFSCDNNQLTSLKGCPKIVGIDFDCGANQLTSLKFCPQNVGDNFNCAANLLTSLEFCPQAIGWSFSCAGNQLTSLQFCPEKLNGYFNCSQNHLISLEISPKKVGGSFYCAENPQLGAAQTIEDFSEVLKIQEKIKIEKEKNRISRQLGKKVVSQKATDKAVLKI